MAAERKAMLKMKKLSTGDHLASRKSAGFGLIAIRILLQKSHEVN
jgi:hypothetical protein